MNAPLLQDKTRIRAPSTRALATKARVLDAAEHVFATKGFDGSTIRDIATKAGEPVGTIHHHGGGKERLFHQVVARRAAHLSEHRLVALNHARQAGPLSVHAVLSAFFRPFFDLARTDEAWRDYARLVAIVSSDIRWKHLAAECFDPTFKHFLETLSVLLPERSHHQLVAMFVYSVSAQLALLTSRDRIGSISGEIAPEQEELNTLIDFCSNGLG